MCKVSHWCVKILKAHGVIKTNGWIGNNYPKLDAGIVFVYTLGNSYPDPGLCEIGPHGYLLPCAHVRIAIPLESGLQFLQLLAGEVSPLPPLAFLFRGVI